MSNNLKSKRRLSVYEKQQLLKYNLSEEEFLKKGEMPVEYFTSWVDFAGLTLRINKNVLIPRVETEELVNHALESLKNNQQKNIKVLDLGTGSGTVALALINQLHLLNYLDKKLDFYLIDLSAEAISLAKNNYQKLLLKSLNNDRVKVNFLKSNLLEKIENNFQFNLILANLPYIPSSRVKKLSSSVKDFEPIIALDGGKTGFELIAKALAQLLDKNLLAKEAILLFETDYSHDYQFLKNYYPSLLKLFEINFIKDQFARQRFLELKIL